ncbi:MULTISPECIES: ScbA/BarX family gamma-butyrolactone biosynthesis protein [Streptomyces]|uniref:ScbA/BarX family gamma-butyrolactone biosynthesis protein n=1 Tax=Streptomyces TaxID=1883 RepID=UPI000699920C|nr:ScbA/BarX family gamma-butyrolactone biosynthesis protein [Streptomyces sp. SID7805]MYU56763.1 transcriptional regulator [Streptomyces sp. SID7805]
MSDSARRDAASGTALFSRVPRELVHKTAPDEVLLTGWRQEAEDHFVVTASWPEQHSFYVPVAGARDPLLAAESVRQAIPLLCHGAYGVPQGHRQIWDHFACALHPDALSADEGPATIELDVSCSDVRRRGSRLAAMTMQVRLMRDGACMGVAHARFTNQPPAIYQRLRGEYADLEAAMSRTIPLAPPISPKQVQRSRFRDVVLSPTNTAQVSQLRVDLAHPVLFDHPVDHAPGMLLLEAARQATHAVAHPHDVVLTGMDCAFSHYAELDAPCWIETSALGNELMGRLAVQVVARQFGREVFSALITAEHSVRT